jgi:Domain of unknown function (DUF4397)
VTALGLIASSSILLSVAATQATAATQVRFLHAVPGAPEATLEVGAGGGEPVQVGGASFGQWTAYRAAPGGKVTAALSAGERRLARVAADLRDGGRFTVVAGRGRGESLVLRIYPDGDGRAGAARVRAVHAASEVDRAEVLLDRRSLGTTGSGEAGDYVTVDPGTYELVARSARGGDAIARRPGLSPSAGTAGTAYLIGSGGERTRFVYATDGASTPTAAPATGLGGLSDDGPSWPLAALAAIVAATLGAATYLTAAARRSRDRA